MRSGERPAGTLLTTALACGWAVSGLAAADEVPLKRVVLFTSGVGYFEHRGEVEGDATVELSFRTEQINDLLKSLVVDGGAGGTAGLVSYGSRDPVTKTLKTFAIDLTKSPSLADLLGQVRGSAVEVATADRNTAGTILGIEVRERVVGEEMLKSKYLTLVTDRGIEGFYFDDVRSVRLVDETLDAELRQALAVLAGARQGEQRTVSIAFDGTGARDVGLGYIREAPLWKTTYRFVTAEGQDGKPSTTFLQGWAIVENQTEADWDGVELALVSGRPISFRMDLDKPFYIPRPLVESERYANVGPVVYGRDLNRREELKAILSNSADGIAPVAAPTGAPARFRASGGNALGLNFEASGYAPSDRFGVSSDYESAGVAVSGGESIKPLVAAADAGELFEYRIGKPVTLPRQSSAMLPIVGAEIEAEKVAVYNPTVLAKHPLTGYRLKNTTDLHLMQGPVTVFAGGGYAGDSRITDVPPGEEQLLTYAVDLDVEVAIDTKGGPQTLEKVVIKEGNLIATRSRRETAEYTIKNSDTDAVKILIERPLRGGWKLVTPAEPTEKTRDRYRFAVDAAGDETTEFEVVESRVDRQSVRLASADPFDRQFELYLTAENGVVDDAVKAALTKVVAKKRDARAVTVSLNKTRESRKAVASDQERLRENLRTLNRGTALYDRYIRKLGTLEDAIEKYDAEIERAEAEVKAKEKSLADYLAGLTVG